MKKTEENLWKFLDNCRGFASVKSLVALTYVLKAWKSKKCSEELSFRKFYGGELSGIKLAEMFRRLAEQEPVFNAYLRQEGEPVRFSSEELASIFNFVNAAEVLPKIGCVLADMFDQKHDAAGAVPDEVAELAARLVLANAKTVYAPFTHSTSFVYFCPDKEYYFEDQSDFSLWIELIKENDGIDVCFKRANPLSEPSFTQLKASHLLRIFDAGICFPPFNVRLPHNQFYLDDKFQRFQIYEGKGCLEIAFIEHILSQVKERAVVLLPMGMMFRSGVDRAFRKYLVEKRLVESLIFCPPGILNVTGIETVLLVLNKNRHHENVFFFNAKNEHFIATKNRKTVLTNIEKIIETHDRKKVLEGISRVVSNEELEKNDYSFAVDRYVLNKETIRAHESLAGYELVRLKDIAELRRSQALPTTDDGEDIHELSPGDLPESGFIEPAGRIKKIDTASSRFKTYQLKTSDILLSSRGTIGKVGIVGNKTDFIASQSFQIIRPRGGVDDAKYLYLFFKSKLGQALLSQSASGVTMPQITPADLARLEIPWPSAHERKLLTVSFEKEVALNQQIEKLKAEVEKLRNDFLQSPHK